MIGINDKNVEDEQQDFFINVIQSKKNIRSCRQFINDLYIHSGGDKMKYIENHVYQLDQNLKFNRDIHFITEQYFSLKHENIVNVMNKKLAESEWKENELMRNFRPECLIQVGQRLESIPDLEKLQGDRVMRNYPIEEGRICIIYIWTIYNSVCKKQLKFLNELYEKNHVWEGTVKLISINSELNRDMAKKFIKSLNLNKMDHLYLDSTKYNHHPLLNLVNKYGYPLCVLVNNDNIIDFCGSLYEIDLQKIVSALLHRELVSSSTANANVGLTFSDRKILKEILSNLRSNCDVYRNHLKAPHLCGATIKISKIYTALSGFQFDNKVKDNNSKKLLKDEKKNFNWTNYKRLMTKVSKSETSSKHGEKENEKSNCQVSCELHYICHEDDDHIFQSLFQGMDQVPKIIMGKQFVETVQIPSAPVNTLCSYCNKSILTFLNSENKESDINIEDLNITNDSFIDDNITVLPQYYCFKCDIHMCKNCGDHLSDLNYPNKVHIHHLYYLHNGNRSYARYILAYNFQNNYDFDFKYYQENTKTPKYISDIRNHYQVSCEACKCFPITTYRWKCCNCVFKNLCDNCKSGSENVTHPNHHMILKNLESKGCNAVTHVFMKIVFDSFVY